MLKNRATNQVFFVVLFTLYLKEDIDEEGNVKPGALEHVGKPFDTRAEEEKQRHGKKGWWWGGGDAAGDEEEDGGKDEEAEAEAGHARASSEPPLKQETEKVVEPTNDDDVD